MNNWLELFEQKEEEIRSKLEEAYKKACSANIGAFRVTHAVILDEDGDIRIQSDTGNSTDGAVWNGKAVYIGAIEDFIPWENDYEWEDWIKHALTNDEIKAIKQFVELDNEDDPNYKIFFNTLEEFDENIYNKVVDESIDCWLEAEMDNWIDRKIEMWKEDQKMYLAQMEECAKD